MGWLLGNDGRWEQQMLAPAPRQTPLDRVCLAVLRGAAHELRDPLTCVLGMADVLDATEPTNEQRVALAELRAAGLRIDEALTVLLDYASADLGPGSGSCTVSAVVIGLRLRHPEARVAVSGVDVGSVLTAPVGALTIILSNLVRNGLRHGRPPVRVEVEAPDTHHVTFTVSDGGDGLPFTFDGPGVAGSRQAASRVGLRLATGLAEALGATLTSAPAAGTRSRLVLTVPLEAPC